MSTHTDKDLIDRLIDKNILTGTERMVNRYGQIDRQILVDKEMIDTQDGYKHTGQIYKQLDRNIRGRQADRQIDKQILIDTEMINKMGTHTQKQTQDRLIDI